MSSRKEVLDKIRNHKTWQWVSPYDEQVIVKALEQEPKETENTEVIEWHSADEPPKDDRYILLVFENWSLPCIGRYEVNTDGSGNYYDGDSDVPLRKYKLIVKEWAEVPKGK